VYLLLFWYTQADVEMGAETTETKNPKAMKKYLKVISFIASGVALGVIAGKLAIVDQRKTIKGLTSGSALNVKNYLQRSTFEDNDNGEYRFV
jgi:hypothetical protein